MFWRHEDLTLEIFIKDMEKYYYFYSKVNGDIISKNYLILDNPSYEFFSVCSDSFFFLHKLLEVSFKDQFSLFFFKV